MKTIQKIGVFKCLAAAVCAALLLAAVVCFGRVTGYGRLLLSQQAAERWQGDSEERFAQVSCFVPERQKISLQDVYGIRTNLLQKYAAAGYDTETEAAKLFTDCWYASGSAEAEGLSGKGTAGVMAVGGNYFHFHPLQLINGCYFGENDFNSDTVLLDEELAWLLFGSNELQGMEVKLDGKVFAVSGVIRREGDFASQKAYQGGMGLYMSYTAWESLRGKDAQETGISVYEVVAAEPIENFALQTMQEIFTVKESSILCNSTRFQTGRLFSLAKDYGTRSIQTNGVVYPYWENAARYLEDRCVVLLYAALVLAFLPGAVLVILLVKGVLQGKAALTERVIPELGDGISERVRRMERKRWEKAHPEDRELLAGRKTEAEGKSNGSLPTAYDDDEI